MKGEEIGLPKCDHFHVARCKRAGGQSSRGHFALSSTARSGIRPHAQSETSDITADQEARLAELYNQLQAVMPVLEEIVQPACAKPESNFGEDRPGEIREAIQLYTPSPGLEGGTGPRYRFENRGREAWAVLDGRDNDALVIIAKYKKGAAALVERLEDYERRIAELSHIPPRPAPAGDGPALPSPP